MAKAIYHIDTDLRKTGKNDFEKDFYNLINNAAFGKYKDTNLVTKETRRNYLVLESNFHTTKFFTEHL